MLQKLLFNKRSIFPLLLIASAAVFFYKGTQADSIYHKLSETFFQTALTSLLLGLCCVVRNGGLFKGLTYIRYRMYRSDVKKQKKYRTIPANEKEDDYAQYIVGVYSKKWNSAPYFFFSGTLVLFYILFQLINIKT